MGDQGVSAINKKAPPRIYCIPATQAPVVAVFRRGPTDWSQVGRWDQAGQLLVATRSGKLQILHLEGDHAEVLFAEDLSRAEPNPLPAPAWARQW